MKSKDIQALHDKTVEELTQLEKELRLQLVKLGPKDKVKNVHVAKERRKDVTRVLTVLREKQFLIEVQEKKGVNKHV